MSETTPVDALSQLFSHLELRARGQAQMLVLTPPWGIAVPEAYREFNMYSVRNGQCVLQIAGEPPVVLNTGDAALVLRNRPHSVHDGSHSNLRPLSCWLDQRAAAGCPDAQAAAYPSATWLITENFTLRGMLGCSFATALGHCVVLRAEEGESSRHQHLFSLLCRESSTPRPGTAFVYSRLMELFFVEFLRECALKHWDDGKPNILRVLFDPQLLRAVQQIHQDPGHPWTVATLARAAGMSRTAFAVRFTSLAGVTPLAYVTRWRMAAAEKMLTNGHTLAEVASQVGYDSEAAFSRAFKRETGTSPGTLRRKKQPDYHAVSS